MSKDGIKVLIEALKSFKKLHKNLTLPSYIRLQQQLSVNLKIKRHHQTGQKELNIDMKIIPELDEAYYGFYAITYNRNC